MNTRKDSVLRRLFAAHDAPRAVRFVSEGQLYMVTTSMLFVGEPQGEETVLAPETRYKVQSRELLNLTDLKRVRPEIFFESMKAELAGVYRRGMYMMPVATVLDRGIWLMDRVEGCRYRRRTVLGVTAGEESFVELPMSLSYLPEYVLDCLEGDGVSLDDFSPVLMRSRTPAVPMVVLTGDSALLGIAVCRVEADPPYGLEIETEDGSVFEGDGYVPDLKYWKKLKKRSKNKMKGLGNPVELTKQKSKIEKAVETPVDGKVVPVKPESEPVDITAEIPADAIPEESVVKAVETPEPAKVVVKPVAKAVEQPSEPAEQTMEPEEPEEKDSQKEDKTRRRQRPQKSVGLDLAKIIEEVSSPVESIGFDQFESAAQELRYLRDLQIAAARRMANISAEVFKTSKTAVDKYQAIQALLK